MTSLGIGVERVVRRGQKMYYITALGGLLEKDLPLEYVESVPHVFLRTKGVVKTLRLKRAGQEIFYLTEGTAVSKETFHRVLTDLYRCAERLHFINKKIERMSAEWHGALTYLIDGKGGEHGHCAKCS